MKSLLYGTLICAMICSCVDSLEDKARKDCEEFTHKFCPTPFVNDERTDSQVFDRSTRTIVFYRTLRGKADNKEVIDANKLKLHEALRTSLDNNTSLKQYREANFGIRFLYRSASHQDLILYEDSFRLKN